MERNSLSKSLKDHSIGSSNSKVKYSWNFNNHSSGEDYLGGFSWPPRSYTCSFCKREFRSAQALGGHMNVHRRDRARLRQSPPRDGHYTILNLNNNPNPNPSSASTPFTTTLPSSTPTSKIATVNTTAAATTTTLSALSSPAFAPSSEINKWAIDDNPFHDPLSTKNFDITRTKTRKSFLDSEEFNGRAREDGCKLLKKAEILRLDLEIGLFSDPKEDLDLELRLGYS